MTLRLRRKRPTTAPSTTTGKAGNSSVGNAHRGVPLLAFGLIFAFASPLFAQIIEPAQFAGDIDARPISEASAGAPLRWKSKPRGELNYQSTPTASTIVEQPVRLGWNITRVDLSVKPVQALSTVSGSDPFNDPFGDRQGVRPAGADTLELQPTQSEAGIEELPAPRHISAPKSIMAPSRSDAGGGLRSASPPAEFFEAAQPAIPTPAEDAAGAVPGRPTVPCERIYNDRNCCENDLYCEAFRSSLLSSSLRQISLDITPRFMPDKTAEENEAERASALSLLELRDWKSRTGELLATGRMSTYQSGSVVIVDDSGTEVARLPWHQLGEDELCYINAWWRLPSECTLGGLRTAERHWAPSTFAWHASGLCHKPLYFEDVQLERYGHTTGPYTQPFISGAHFFLNIATLPYHMGINPPHECQYALGYYRPGNCAPWMLQPVPLSLRGALLEAGVIVGGVYIIP